jgi:hypothetical protein
MTKNKTTCEIIKKIKKDEIKPVPKWQCCLFDILVWAGVFFAIILSSLFLSLVMINLFEIPFHIFSINYFGLLIRFLPFVWLGLIGIFLFLGFLIFNKTKKAYRYRVLMIIAILFLVTLLFSLVLGRLKIDRHIRNFTENKIPQSLSNRPSYMVFCKRNMAEEGLLGGELMQKKKDYLLVKNDLNESWEVILTPETRIKRKANLLVGDKILILGDKIGVLSFQAKVIKRIEENKNSFK